MTTATKPARVLTVEQREELWELFCSYGRLRTDAESAAWLRQKDESKRLRRDANDVQDLYGELIWSLTEMAG